eukprot:SAG11_NODE_30579_length_299_cov_1.810000_1_plen_30_part_01
MSLRPGVQRHGEFDYHGQREVAKNVVGNAV